MIGQRMNVQTAEAYVDELLAAPPVVETPEELQSRRRTMFVLKDVRVFLNTLAHGLDMMKQGGIDADLQKHETDSELVLTISIPKQK